MWLNEYWLSLMAFAAIVCFGLVFAVHCCGLGEGRHNAGSDRGVPVKSPPKSV